MSLGGIQPVKAHLGVRKSLNEVYLVLGPGQVIFDEVSASGDGM
jgi:hypothetical protein